MKDFRADLHMHTCLSSCAELDMTPRRIVAQAQKVGLDIIAITDHNSARNVEVAVELGREAGLLVIPGMEVCSSEEAHLLALFGQVADAIAMQELIYRGLAPMGNKIWQVVVDSEDAVDEFEELALIGASTLMLAEVPDAIKQFGGLSVASHIDREAFSITSQFGFVPDGVIFDAYEVIEPERAGLQLQTAPELPWLASSDAHYLRDIGQRYTVFTMEEATFSEMVLAIKGQGGRGVRAVFG